MKYFIAILALFSASAFAGVLGPENLNSNDNTNLQGQGQGQAQGQGQLQGQAQGQLQGQGQGQAMGQAQGQATNVDVTNRVSNNVGALSGSVSDAKSNSVSGAISGSVSSGGDAKSSSFSGGGDAKSASFSAGGDGGKSNAKSASNSGGNTLTVNEAAPAADQSMRYSGSYTVKGVPNVISGAVYPTAPCMGSSTVGGSGVGFGVSIGHTWKDDECGIRETARSFAGMGLKEDALKVLCASQYAATAPSCAVAQPKE